jgi:hypothetical protein
LQGSNREQLLVLLYVNDLDSNTSNPIGIKATLLAYETTILITVRDSKDFIFKIESRKYLALVSGKMIDHKDKPLALG